MQQGIRRVIETRRKFITLLAGSTVVGRSGSPPNRALRPSSASSDPVSMRANVGWLRSMLA